MLPLNNTTDNEFGTFKMVSLNVPANIVYEWNIPNTCTDLLPFGGLNLRGNIWSNADNVKFFQIGWHIGARVRLFKKFITGGAYGTDFMDYCPKHKLHTGTIMLGYTF